MCSARRCWCTMTSEWHTHHHHHDKQVNNNQVDVNHPAHLHVVSHYFNHKNMNALTIRGCSHWKQRAAIKWGLFLISQKIQFTEQNIYNSVVPLLCERNTKHRAAKWRLHPRGQKKQKTRRKNINILSLESQSSSCTLLVSQLLAANANC